LLAPIIDAGVDTLVLGCTHYPLLARTISDVVGREMVLVSSADETAFAVRTMLTEARSASTGAVAATKNHERPRHLFLTSGSVDTFRVLATRFLGPEVEQVEAWQWD